MTPIGEIEELMVRARDSYHGSTRSIVGRSFDNRKGVVCHFSFEPSLRYVRYVSSFNRILNEYTGFDFTVEYIQHGCIDVGYLARDFNSNEKNYVRRRIRDLSKYYNLSEDFSIKYLLVFGKRNYA